MSVRIIQGDVRKELPKLSADYVDCIVTSPPYYGLRDYVCDAQIGLEPTLDAYLETIVAVCRELRRVLKPSGVFFLNVSDSYQKDKSLYLMPQHLAILLKRDGWIVRSNIIWSKKNPMPESVTDRPTSAHETIWMLTKRANYFWDAEAVAEVASTFNRQNSNGPSPKRRSLVELRGDKGNLDSDPYGYAARSLRNVWSVASHPFPGAHFATFPPAIVERCIKAGSSERGCCPACGAPWVRITGRSEQPKAYQYVKYDEDDPAFRTKRNMGARYQAQLDANPIKTLGWEPPACIGRVCKLSVADPIPSRILDPFAGSGTVGLVADRLGRDATLIDLNTSYIDMAVDRIRDDAPLFAEVAAE